MFPPTSTKKSFLSPLAKSEVTFSRAFYYLFAVVPYVQPYSYSTYSFLPQSQLQEREGGEPVPRRPRGQGICCIHGNSNMLWKRTHKL